MSLKEIADNLRKLADEIEALGSYNPAQPRLPLTPPAAHIMKCWQCGQVLSFEPGQIHFCPGPASIGIIDNG